MIPNRFSATGSAFRHTPETISALSEERFRRDVLIRLLAAMGMENVFEWHGGPGELGKDIIATDRAVSGAPINIALVVKATRLSRNAELFDVAAQVAQALGEPAIVPSTGTEWETHQCWVVTNKRLARDARLRIRATIAEQWRRFVQIYDIDDIWRLTEEHLIRPIPTLLQHVQGELERRNLPEGLVIRVSRQEVGFALEAVEGVEPPVVSGRVQFTLTDDEAGRAAQAQLDRQMRTGETAVLPGQFVRFDLGDNIKSWSEDILGFIPEQTTSFEIGTADDGRRFPISIAVTADDGESTNVAGIEFRVCAVGIEQLTLSNEHQQYPFLVQFSVDLTRMTTNIHWTARDESVPAPVLLGFTRMMRLLAQPGSMEIRQTSDGLLIHGGHHDGKRLNNSDPPTEDDEHLYALLTEIQDRTRQVISIPQRRWTSQEIRAVDELVDGTEGQPLVGHWSSETFKLAWESVDARQGFPDFRKLPEFRLILEREEMRNVFGTEVSIGRVRYDLKSAELIDVPFDELEQKDGGVVVPLRPKTSDEVHVSFLDWPQPSLALDHFHKTGQRVEPTIHVGPPDLNAADASSATDTA